MQMAYYDKKRYATDDAMRVARLHTFLPGWTDANVAFMRSGGYAISARIKDVRCPTLVVWGRNDEILRCASVGREGRILTCPGAASMGDRPPSSTVHTASPTLPPSDLTMLTGPALAPPTPNVQSRYR
jgi:pimeloyl-ACP methyl ester carboxylesterase